MNFVSAGKIFDPIYSCSMHKHPEWEIIYQLRGHTCATAGGTLFQLREGDLIVIPPNTSHNTASDMLIIDMHIRLKVCDFPTSPFVVTDDGGDIGQLFHMLLNIYLKKDEGYALFAEKLSELICLHIKKAINKQPTPKFIVDFKALAADNIGNAAFSVTDSIKQSGYHPDYFRRLFKKYMGISPHAYLTELRIDHAKELLTHEKYLTIGEISRRCGFSDNLYFSSCFKQNVGISPLRFRKTIHEP